MPNQLNQTTKRLVLFKFIKSKKKVQFVFKLNLVLPQSNKEMLLQKPKS